MPLVAESLEIVPVLDVPLLFVPNVSEQPRNVGVEFSAHLPQACLRDERIVPHHDIKTFAPVVRVAGQGAPWGRSRMLVLFVPTTRALVRRSAGTLSSRT